MFTRSPSFINAYVLVASIGLTLCLLLPAPAAADREIWVKADRARVLHSKPDPLSVVTNTLPADTAARVKLSRLRQGKTWVKVARDGRSGWIIARRLERTLRPLVVTPRTRRALRQQATATGLHAGVVIRSAATGQVLFEQAPRRRRVLASNTKLFVTGYALNRFGVRFGSLVARILQPSDNSLAELLSRSLGGAGAVRRFAHRMGSRVILKDGSGLSHGNRATPTEVTDFLIEARTRRWYPFFVGGLPLAGRTGTLATRTRGTMAAGSCRAKTGTVRKVSTLSGYCTTRADHRIAFSFLMGSDGYRARPRQDRLLSLIVARL